MPDSTLPSKRIEIFWSSTLIVAALASLACWVVPPKPVTRQNRS
jgi:hypothetical protein